MKLVIFSDIHANLTAFKAVLQDIDAKNYNPDGVIQMGDIINYGMRPNEVIEELRSIKYPIIANLFGNHEKALLDGDYSSFSTERGKSLMDYTKGILNEQSLGYINDELNHDACQDFEINGKKILLIHGSIENHFWGKFDLSKISDVFFSKYDYVITGHSHLSHVVSFFYPVDNPQMRNKKKTIFINPGSVGQPRNQNPGAQYAFVDLETSTIHLNSVQYDIAAEQELFPYYLDSFYKNRLFYGV